MRKCEIDGCSKPYCARGLCKSHYEKRRHGWKDKPTPDGAALAFMKAAIESNTDACIEWPFNKLRGYGRMRDPRTNGSIPAHRYACEMVHGLGGQRQTRHLCHNRGCVNPRHLAWGTAKENVADSIMANRRSIGTRRPNAKLNDEIVRHIRTSELSSAKIAAELGVSKSIVSFVRAGRTWRHVQ